MKHFAIVILAIAFAGSLSAQEPPKIVPPKTKTPIVPLTISAKAGELICIDAKLAKGDVLFVYDKKTFDAKHAILMGKAMILTSPVTKETKLYIVVVTSWEDRTQDEVVLTVQGTDGPTPPDPGATPIEKLSAKVDALTKIVTSQSVKIDALTTSVASQDKRLTALEQIKPNPPPGKPAVSLTFVVLSPNQATASVTEDAPFRAWLKSNSLAIYGMTTQAQIDANPRFKGVAPPCIVLQDATGAVVETATITTVAAAQALVTKHLK